MILKWLYVLPEYRRRGAAGSFLETGEDPVCVIPLKEILFFTGKRGPVPKSSAGLLALEELSRQETEDLSRLLPSEIVHGGYLKRCDRSLSFCFLDEMKEENLQRMHAGVLPL